MPEQTGPRLVARWEQLQAQRRLYERIWQDIGDYIVPHKATITSQPSPGQKQTDKLFDGTAIQASTLLAASLHGTMTPSTQPWLSFLFRQDDLNEQEGVRDWLEDSARRIDRALRNSNFNTSIHEMYLDLVHFATGCLFCEEQTVPSSGGFGGLRFQEVPVGTYCVAEDAEGRVDTVFWRQRLSLRAAVGKWQDRIGEKWAEKARSKPDDLVEILHAVLPRRDRNPTREANPRHMAWASYYLVLEDKRVIDEGGFHEFPFMVPRWTKTSGEVYGRGPSHLALPDVKTVNAAKEFILKAAPMSIWPPTLERDDSVVGDLDLNPAGRNVTNWSGDLDQAVKFLDTKTRADLSQLLLQDLRQAIRETYYVPQLQLPEGPTMTATEVQVRYELLQRLLGPTTGRLESEFLNPLVERVFGILARAGALTALPEGLGIADSEVPDLDIKYEGPLARAQRTIELAAQDRMVGFASAVSPVYPAIWDVLDLDQMARDRAEITGLSQKAVREPSQVKTIRDTRAQQEAIQAQIAQGAQVAKAAGDAAPALTALTQAAQANNGGGR